MELYGGCGSRQWDGLAGVWRFLLVYGVFSQAIWVDIVVISCLRRSIHLYAPLCITHCPFCRHITENAFIKSTPRFCHCPGVGRYGFPASRLRLVRRLRRTEAGQPRGISLHALRHQPTMNASISPNSLSRSGPNMPKWSESSSTTNLRCVSAAPPRPAPIPAPLPA